MGTLPAVFLLVFINCKHRLCLHWHE